MADASNNGPIRARQCDKTRYANAVARNTRQCETCAKPFYANRRNLSGKQIAAGHVQRFCSSICRGLSMRVYSGKVEAKRAERDRLKARKGLPPTIPPPAGRECSVCSKTFKPQMSASHICSQACRTIYKRQYAKALNVALVGDKTERPCSECGSVFTPKYGDKKRAFCTKQCSRRSGRRTAKHVRRARKAQSPSESIDATKVFQRDGWKCWACGIATPRSQRGTTEPNAPELDHVVALAEGGSHTYGNVRCACRQCNHARGIETARRLKQAA